jgi:hypothetical protein
MAKAKCGFFFKDWVEFYGRRRLAEDLKIKKCTCDKWAQGNGHPEVKHMRSIKRMTSGKIDYHHMIDGVEIQSGAL